MPFDASNLSASTEPSGTAADLSATESQSAEGGGGEEGGAVEGEGLSRRDRLATESIAAYESRISGTEKQLSEARDREARNAQEIARLRGMVEAQVAMAASANKPPPPDYDKIMAESLEKGDMAGYHKALKESMKADLAPARSETAQQQSGQPSITPKQMQARALVQAELVNHPELAADPKWAQRIQAADKLLEVDGIEDGPARWRQAIIDASARMPGAKKRPAYPAGGNGALASNGGHASTAAIDAPALTTAHREIAKRAGMKESEYAKGLQSNGPVVYTGKW